MVELKVYLLYIKRSVLTMTQELPPRSLGAELFIFFRTLLGRPGMLIGLFNSLLATLVPN
jgi:hypothetical protein